MSLHILGAIFIIFVEFSRGYIYSGLTVLFRKKSCIVTSTNSYCQIFCLFLFDKSSFMFYAIENRVCRRQLFFKWKGWLSQYFSQTRFLQKSSKVSRDQQVNFNVKDLKESCELFEWKQKAWIKLSFSYKTTLSIILANTYDHFFIFFV